MEAFKEDINLTQELNFATHNHIHSYSHSNIKLQNIKKQLLTLEYGLMEIYIFTTIMLNLCLVYIVILHYQNNYRDRIIHTKKINNMKDNS